MAQFLGLLASPLITRLFGPTQYGLAGTYLSFTAVLSVVFSLSLSTALIIEIEDSKSKFITSSAAFISIFLFGVLSTIYLIAAIMYFLFFDLYSLGASLAVVSVFAISAATAVVELQKSELNRVMSFTALAWLTITAALALAIFRTMGGAVYPEHLVYLISTLIALGVTYFVASTFLKVQPLSVFKSMSLARLWWVSRSVIFRYRNITTYLTARNLLFGLTQSLLPAALAVFASPAAAGFYILANATISAPSLLVSSSAATAILPRLAKLKADGEPFRILLLSACLALLLLAILLYAPLIAFSDLIYSTVYGSEWERTAQFVPWVVLMVASKFVLRPALVGISLVGMERPAFFLDALSTCMRIGGVLLLFSVGLSPVSVVGYFAIVVAITNFCTFLLTAYASE